jgi:hypothetical protein
MSAAEKLEPTLLDAALAYARKSLPVFPCDPATKRPLIENGLNGASADLDIVGQWWARWPDAMIGMPTGSRTRFWALDIDDPATFEANCKIDLPPTRRCNTGKGYHLLFKWDPKHEVRNKQRHPKHGWPISSLPGAETRGEGGYVIVPPSVHPNGRRYQWQDESIPMDAAPPALLKAVRSRQADDRATTAPLLSLQGADTPYGLAALDAECSAIRSAGNGEQEGALNEAAFKIGGLCAGGALSIDTARSRLISAGLSMPSYNARDQWTSAAIVAKIERALSDGAATPRSAPDRQGGGSGGADHTDAGAAPGSAEDLGYTDAETGEWHPYDEDWTEPDAPAEPEPHASLNLAELAKCQPQPKQFSIARLAPTSEVTLFTGPGSAGKSLLAQQFATAAAAGINCMGFDVQPTASIYLTCEDDVQQLHWRQAHLCRSLDVDMAALAGRLHLISLRGELGNDLCTFGQDGTLRLAAGYQRLVATIKASGAGQVWLDNVAHLFTGNENDRGEVTRFVNLLNRLAGETGAAIVLLGHPNKIGDSYSGSTAWLNAVRSQFFIEHDVETDLRTLTVGKANYAQKGEGCRFLWHDWAFVREDDLPPDTARELTENIKASADNKLFLACLAERNKQRRQVSERPTAQNYAPKIFESMPESKGLTRKRLELAMDRLFRVGTIERGFLWRDTGEGKNIEGLREVGQPSPE